MVVTIAYSRVSATIDKISLFVSMISSVTYRKCATDGRGRVRVRARARVKIALSNERFADHAATFRDSVLERARIERLDLLANVTFASWETRGDSRDTFNRCFRSTVDLERSSRFHQGDSQTERFPAASDVSACLSVSDKLYRYCSP